MRLGKQQGSPSPAYAGEGTAKLKKKKRLLPGVGFATAIALPLFLHFVFMVAIGMADAIALPFQEFNGREFVALPMDDLFKNFNDFFSDVKNDPDTLRYIGNGYLFATIGFFFGLFSLFLAFAAARKLPGFSFFTWILILPGIFGGLINYLLFKYFVEKALPVIMLNWFQKEIPLLFVEESTALGTTFFMQYYFSFAGSLLFYTGQFGKVPNELWEYGKLEGLSFLQEFIYIGFPSIFSVWSLSHIAILTTGLTTTGPGYALYGANGYKYGVVTWGYHMLVTVLTGRQGDSLRPEYAYPYTAAVNLVTALLQMAGAFIMVKVFEKLDPQAEF